MRNDCSICCARIPIGRGTAIGNGKICRECSRKFPDALHPYATALYSYDIEQIIRYEESCAQKFSCTASYGTLNIDEMHGLFCVTKRPEKFVNGAVFRFLDLDEIGLYCTNPQVTAHGVVCDVVFAFCINKLHLDCKFTVKKQTVCANKRIDREHISWEEPGAMSLFRNMINQTIQTAEAKYHKAMEPNFISKAAVERFKAMALFMLDEGYDITELKAQRNRLIKAFHPDVSNAPDKYIIKVNDAYDLLLAEIKKGTTEN